MSDANRIKLGLIQHACPVDATREQNLAKAVGLIREAAGKGAQLIATQELFTGCYFPQIEDDARFDLAEPVPGPTCDTLCKLADELSVEITASLFEKRAPGLYHNTSVMIDTKGKLVGKYRKMHIPDDPRFYEKYYFTPGDAPGKTVSDTVSKDQTSGGIPGPDPDGFDVQHMSRATTGMLVCWDQWFPEAARLTALRGAQILFYPTAIGWFHGEPDDEKPRQRDAWQTMQRSHAIANGVFVAAINRVGTENDLTFWGHSFVADPGGRIIAQASGDKEQVLLADCDLSQIEKTRRGWPFLRDRRVDAYGGLLKRMIDE
ncbi:MAG: carbon-nitrogen hydrolase [Phycisphaerales bacterium]